MSNHLSDQDYHSVSSSTTSLTLDNVKEHSITQNSNDNSILTLSDIQSIIRKHYQPIVSAQNGVKDLRTQLIQRANSLSTDLHLEIKSLTKTMNHPELNQELVQEIGSKLLLRLKILFDFPPYILQHIVNNNIFIQDIQDVHVTSMSLSRIAAIPSGTRYTKNRVPNEKSTSNTFP
jgi:hypothetical protein